MIKRTAGILAVVAMAGHMVCAGEPPPSDEGYVGGLGLTAKIGTLGYGGEATLGITEYLGLRLGVNTFSWELNSRSDERTIQLDLNWLTYAGLVDLHPFGGGFRVTGGAMVNNNKFKLRADLAKPVELNDQEFELKDLHGEVTFADFAPYAGIGYGNAVGKDGHWHFACDFGVMNHGEPKINAHAVAQDPALQGVLDAALAQEVSDYQDDIRAYQWYPVISLGVSFTF